jgi:hypothetical protein
VKRHVAPLAGPVTIVYLLALLLALTPTAFAHPNPVTLFRFEADAGPGQIQVTWETATELNTVAFRLRRSSGSADVFTEVALLPARGDAVSGAVYTFVDTKVSPGVRLYYILDVIDTTGATITHGPVSAVASAPCGGEVVCQRVYLPLLSLAQPAPEDAFWADRYALTRGECTILHWSVFNAVAIFFQNEGVAGQEVRQVCPSLTTDYELKVVRSSGTSSRHITISVRP